MLTTGLFRRKSLDQLVGETADPRHQLRRALGPLQLTMLGVGAIVGAGIFSTPGTAAAGGAEHIGAGPALVISFLIVAVACGFAALCYSEFAAMVPVSGSAYTYAYATLGELAAWLIGWDLILEYAISNAAVAVSWSGYFQVLLDGLHIHLPAWLGTDFRSAMQAAAQVASTQAAHLDPAKLDPSVLHDALAWQTAPQLAGLRIIFNLPAFGIVLLVTWIVLIGIRETARFNTALVIGKLAIVLFFLVLGAMYIRPENWVPFAPNGVKGISSAAAIIFFAYIGFDAVSTAAEETRNPQRDMPIGILASLGICTVLYIAVAIVLTGMAKWNKLGNAEPLAYAFSSLGMNWTAGIIAVGCHCGHDLRAGALSGRPAAHLLRHGPRRPAAAVGGQGASALPHAARHHDHHRHLRRPLFLGRQHQRAGGIDQRRDPLRLHSGSRRHYYPAPHRPRPATAIPHAARALGAAGRHRLLRLLMFELPRVTWIRFFGWMAAGLVLYFLYGFRRSRLGRAP